MTIEWRLINKEDYMPDEAKCLHEPEPRLRYCFLADRKGNVWQGFNASDFFDEDAIYWYPRPSYPMADPVITHPDATIRLARLYK
jgi:hypothetical protein